MNLVNEEREVPRVELVILVMKEMLVLPGKTDVLDKLVHQVSLVKLVVLETPVHLGRQEHLVLLAILERGYVWSLDFIPCLFCLAYVHRHLHRVIEVIVVMLVRME